MPNFLQVFNVPGELKEREKIYIEVRKKEGRLYPDEIVKILPEINNNHPLYKEWKIRAATYYELEKYIKDKNGKLQILDLGCGNGWMANKLSSLKNVDVTAMDVNLEELEQGARVFDDNNNLKFNYGDIFDTKLNLTGFDIIVCASSIQYFPDLNKLIDRLFDLLNQKGEIHIIDSPLYDETNAGDAEKRSNEYYKNLNIELMATNYFHHTWSELYNYKYRIIRESLFSKVWGKLTGKESRVFPHIIIEKN